MSSDRQRPSSIRLVADDIIHLGGETTAAERTDVGFDTDLMRLAVGGVSRHPNQGESHGH